MIEAAINLDAGLEIKRTLLEAAVVADPEPAAFEGWLLERCLAPSDGASVGSMRAMALEVLGDSFAAWLTQGAPSEDAGA